MSSRPSTGRGMTTGPSEVPASGWFDTGGAPAAPFDVAVIGAGPAGLAAAVAAVVGDARVVLLDAAPRLGGQYWRHRPGDDGARHHDWHAFAGLRDAAGTAAAAGTLVHLAGAQVWHVAREADGFVVHALDGDRGRDVRARDGRPRHRRLRPPAAVPGLDPARRVHRGRAPRRCSRAAASWSGSGSSWPGPGRSCCRWRPGWPRRARRSSACSRPGGRPPSRVTR